MNDLSCLLVPFMSASLKFKSRITGIYYLHMNLSFFISYLNRHKFSKIIDFL